jgi:hypothetical protein
MEAEDQFTLTPDAAPDGLMPLGVVIKTPDQLAAEVAPRVPYEKADRTPEGNLKELHAFAAHQLQVKQDTLISLAGEICEHGSVLVLAHNADETPVIDPLGWVVVSYDSRPASYRVQTRRDEQHAREAYAARVEALS